MAANDCAICQHKQRRIDELEDEAKRLRTELRYEERKAEEGFFGSSTPSSKKPWKPNGAEKAKKPRGAKRGHKGWGRRSHGEEEADRSAEVGSEVESRPDCGAPLEKKGWEDRSVVDTPRQKAEEITYRLVTRYCPHCRRSIIAQAPGVLPKSLFGSKLIADAVAMHYLHGVPIGRISEYLQVGVRHHCTTLSTLCRTL